MSLQELDLTPPENYEDFQRWCLENFARIQEKACDCAGNPAPVVPPPLILQNFDINVFTDVQRPIICVNGTWYCCTKDGGTFYISRSYNLIDWTNQATVGEIREFSATPDGVNIIAIGATNKTAYVSNDSGDTWDVVTSPFTSAFALASVGYIGYWQTFYVSLGGSVAAVYSQNNGVSWSPSIVIDGAAQFIECAYDLQGPNLNFFVFESNQRYQPSGVLGVDKFTQETVPNVGYEKPWIGKNYAGLIGYTNDYIHWHNQDGWQSQADLFDFGGKRHTFLHFPKEGVWRIFPYDYSGAYVYWAPFPFGPFQLDTQFSGIVGSNYVRSGCVDPDTDNYLLALSDGTAVVGFG